MDKQLRLIAGTIVVESKLSSSAKLQLLNFIKEEASDAQIKALLMDGEIQNLDEQAEQIVEQRWELSEVGGKIAQTRKSLFSRMGAPLKVPPVAAIWALYRVIRGQFDVCTKRCGTFELNTARRQHCLAKCKVVKAQAELNAVMKSKNPKQIQSKRASLEKANERLRRYQQSFSKKSAPGQ